MAAGLKLGLYAASVLNAHGFSGLATWTHWGSLTMLVSAYASYRCKTLSTSEGEDFGASQELAAPELSLPCCEESPAPSPWAWTSIGMKTRPVARARVVLAPSLSVAVSRTLSVWPRSPPVGVYCGAVAPGMSAQLVPAASQRTHCFSTVGLWTQTSCSALSVWSSAGTPSMNGRLKAHGRSDVHVPVTPAHPPGENPSS